MGKIVLRLTFAVAILLSASSCEYKPLEYDFDYAGKGHLIFDWSKAPYAEVAYMMTVMHQVGEAGIVRFELSKDGGYVRVNPGEWMPVAFNATCTIQFISDDRPDNYVATTRVTSIQKATGMVDGGAMPRTKASENEPVILEPDLFWFALGAPMYMPANAEPAEQTVEMEPRTIEIELVIRGVPNLAWTTQFGGCLSGLASGVDCASGIPLTEPATQAFYMYSPEDSTLVARIVSFGLCPGVDGIYPKNHLVTYVYLNNGTKWYCVQDITDILRNAPFDENRRLMTVVVIGGVPIPVPVNADSGFHPSVDDWVGVEIDLSMSPE